MKGGKVEINPTDAACEEVGGVYLAIELSDSDVEEMYQEHLRKEMR